MDSATCHVFCAKKPAKLLRQVAPPLLAALGLREEKVSSPDYESYSLEELYEAYNSVNRESWPDRVKQIEEILNDPEKVQVLKLEAERLGQSEYGDSLLTSFTKKISYYAKGSYLWVSIFCTTIFLFAVIHSTRTGEINFRGSTYLREEGAVFYWLLLSFCIWWLLFFSSILLVKLTKKIKGINN